MARSTASRNGNNSASSAVCSARSITFNISISSSGCATTTSISARTLDGHARFDSATVERAYGDLIDALTKVLHGANFVEVPHEEIERAHREHGIVRVNIKAPLEDYREVRFFRRGHHNETVEVAKWSGFGKRSVEFGVYDDVVLLVTMKMPPRPAKSAAENPRCGPARCCSNISAISPAPT